MKIRNKHFLYLTLLLAISALLLSVGCGSRRSYTSYGSSSSSSRPATPHYNRLAPPHYDASRVLVLGQVQLKWDNFRGRNYTTSSEFKVSLVRKIKNQVVSTYPLDLDSQGYFAIPNVPAEGDISLSTMRGRGWSLKPPGISIGISKRSAQRVAVLGGYTAIVKHDGKVSWQLAFSSIPTLNYFLGSKRRYLGDWLPYVEREMQRAKSKKKKK